MNLKLSNLKLIKKTTPLTANLDGNVLMTGKSDFISICIYYQIVVKKYVICQLKNDLKMKIINSMKISNNNDIIIKQLRK